MARYVSTRAADGSTSGGAGGIADGNDYMWRRIYHCAKWTKDYGHNFWMNLPTCEYQAFRFLMNGVMVCPSNHMCWCFGFGYNEQTIQSNNNKYYGWCNWCWPSRSCCCWSNWAEGNICAWSHQTNTHSGAGQFDLCIFQWGQCGYGNQCYQCQVGFDLKWRGTECCGWKRRWGYSYDWLSAMDWIPEGASHYNSYCGCTFDSFCICSPQTLQPACCTWKMTGTKAFQNNWALYGIPWGHVHKGDTSDSSTSDSGVDSGVPTT